MLFSTRVILPASLLLVGTPFVASAAVGNVYQLETFAIDILMRLFVLFWVLAILCFVWGMVRFIANANDPERREQGKQFIVWGIVAFLVIFSIWGIARMVLYGSLGLAAPELQYKDKNGTLY